LITNNFKHNAIHNFFFEICQPFILIYKQTKNNKIS